MKIFCHAIVAVFSEWYLRSPTTKNLSRLLNIGQLCGFPRMLGSVCIGSGKIVQLHVHENFPVVAGYPRSFSKQLRNMIYGYGMSILECHAATTILMF